MHSGMGSRVASHHCVVVDATTGHPLAGIASPELTYAAAVEDGLVFSREVLGVWLLVDAEPRVLAFHRRAGHEVRLVQVTGAAAHGSAA